ncbi:type IX secretion system ring subunit PorN/GldN [Nafulsella turpanensis]|uniref:type IX secretion system ring protein PorN/GldN n=1 Tax=Nafulsella turpanensis TaxID=1265690 RepID=UPI00058C8C6E|nr:gliding motility protein GldN [Nafulsella turpanensis]
MKKLCYVLVLGAFMTMAGVETSQAQETVLEYNPNSVHPIRDSDILLKKRIWRRIDLEEKQNKPFFAFNNEISKIMVEAVKAGVLTPYMNDSLTTRMPREEFLERIKLPEVAGGLTEEEKAMGFGQEEASGWDTGAGWGDEPATDTAKTTVVEDAFDEFLPRDMNILELMEDMIFDKKRSRLYWDIQAVTLIIPGTRYETGLQKAVATFKYKDLVELFRSMPGEAIWFNPQNSGAHLNLSDAFALRLFDGRIIKVGNPDDALLVEIYDKSPKEGLMASQWIEMELLELEHELWEY